MYSIVEPRVALDTQTKKSTYKGQTINGRGKALKTRHSAGSSMLRNTQTLTTEQLKLNQVFTWSKAMMRVVSWVVLYGMAWVGDDDDGPAVFYPQ